MKIRNGFVSNSSSSSFILAFPKGKKLKANTKVTIEFDIEDITQRKIKTKEELLNFFKCEYGLEEAELEDNSWYKDGLRAIEKGKILYCGNVGNEDDNIFRLLIYDRPFEKSDKYEIIKNSGDD